MSSNSTIATEQTSEIAAVRRSAASAADVRLRVRSSTKRVLASTTVLLAGMLIIANVAFGFADPARLIPTEMTPQETAVRAVTYKMNMLSAARSAPDVLLVGSSLPMAVAYYADSLHRKPMIERFIAESEPLKLNPFQSYAGAQYFSDLIAAKFGGRPVSVFNITAPACMTSDARFLLTQAVSRKKPKLVIWGIAPRDFVDNVIPAIGKTPAFAALPDFAYLPNVLPFQKSFAAGADSFLASFVRFYNDRPSWKHLFSDFTCEALQHPANLTASTSVPAKPNKVAEAKTKVKSLKAAPQAVALNKLAADGAAREPGWNQSLVAQYVDYYHRYNPPNHNLFEAQAQQFAKALSFCRANGIKVVVVDMPLPRKHQELIDSSLYAKYRARVTSLATANGATYLDLNHPDRYNADDWIDSLHVTNSGADKFLAELVPLLPPVREVY